MEGKEKEILDKLLKKFSKFLDETFEVFQDLGGTQREQHLGMLNWLIGCLWKLRDDSLAEADPEDYQFIEESFEVFLHSEEQIEARKFSFVEKWFGEEKKKDLRYIQ